MIATSFRLSLVAFVLFAALPSIAAAQFSSSQVSDSESAGDDSGSKKPAAVAMEVWVVTIQKVTSLVDDDQFGKTLAEAANLPADLGDRNDVRMLVERWEQQGMVGRLEHFRASARSGQVATVVPTEQVPMIVGVTLSDKGRTNNLQLRPVGTSLKLKPLVVGQHRIAVDVEYENTELVDSEHVNIAEPKGEDPQPAKGTKSITIQSVVDVPNGHVVLVMYARDSQQTASKLVLIGAEFLKQ